MIHVPINVTGWVPAEDLRVCNQCDAIFHKLYERCPKCDSLDWSVLREWSPDGRTLYETVIPVLDNAP